MAAVLPERSPIAQRISISWLHKLADSSARAGSSTPQEICRQILAREPSHVIGNSIAGLVCQAFGRDESAIKYFTEAIASDESSASFHYNAAISYQRLNCWNDAVAHFTRAIALRMDGMAVEGFIAQNPIIQSCLVRIAQQWPQRLTIEALFGAAGVAAIADDALLRCALRNTRLSGPDMEFFLTSVRHALLQVTMQAAPEFVGVNDKELGVYAALAKQCFIDEYVLDQTADETLQAEHLRNLLLEKLRIGDAISTAAAGGRGSLFSASLAPCGGFAMASRLAACAERPHSTAAF